MENKIIIFENNQVIYNSCKYALEKKGYKVFWISDSEGLKDYLSIGDILIIDHESVKEGFLDLLKDIKEKRPALFIIVIAKELDSDSIISWIENGANVVLKTPIQTERLLSLIERHISWLSVIEEEIKVKAFIPLYELTEKFIVANSENEVLQVLIQAINKYIGADRISVMIYDEKKDVLRIRQAVGLDKEIIKNTEIKPGESIAGWVFEKKRPVIIDGIQVDDELSEIRPLLKKKDIVSMSIPIICVPVYVREKTLGVVNVSKKKNAKAFTKSDMEMVSVICRQAALAIENIRSQNERAEKLRIKTLLERYMPPEVVELLISDGKDPMSLGEIKDVVILFADIKDFTLLVQRIPINTTRDFLNEFFGLLTDVVFKFHGTLDKFIGDAALAIFGFPISLKQPAQSAIQAAVEIRESFKKLKNKWSERQNAFKDIGIGIGITGGEVFIGNVGTKKRFDFTAVGLDVNLAQRLASDAKDGEILISEKVKEKLHTGFKIEKKTSYFLKGEKRPISIYIIK